MTGYSRPFRSREERLLRSLLRLAALVVASAVAIAALWYFFSRADRPVSEVDGVKQVSGVVDGRLAVYDGTGLDARFWNGVNLGATLPGHSPGDLAPAREDYLRWFGQMKEMNVDVVRVYTILPPHFYETLREFNASREDPLWLVQGIWSPEEDLIGTDEEGRDAHAPEIKEAFEAEITDAVRVVHGDASLPTRTGHASGEYGADVSEYMLGWMSGTEWYPYAVRVTDDANEGMAPYSGEYFHATAEATPFESWLASMLDTLAKEEMRYGWQHPAAFTNWLTTDPMSHPNEPLEQEDLVSVDPMHVAPTGAWKAGYYAQYHVYPYYPDFLRYQEEYQTYRDAEGEVDPYAAYLNELRAHHQGIPLVVGEFGVPSSRGMAHYGLLGRNQGYHTEQEQGEINADLLEAIRSEGLDGAMLFAWQDEWFKFTWNTVELELPKNRRQMWRNRLTNEENFGVISTEAGESAEETVFLDGATDDWDLRESNFLERLSDRVRSQATTTREERPYEDFDLSATHDEAYLYLLLKKREGEWDLEKEELDIGFGTLPDGAPAAPDEAPGLGFPDGGAQFLLRMRGDEGSRMLVNSAYDQHTWLYAERLDLIPDPETSQEASAGDFLPWNLALNRGLFLPQTRERAPFEEIEVGKMRQGITDPESPEFDNLADWYTEGDVLEIRIPWMLLGYTDPSSHQVWNSPYEAGKFEPVTSEELRIYPALRPTGDPQEKEIEALSYSWESWEQPTSHERKKKGFDTLSEAFRTGKQLEEPRTSS